MSTFVRRRQSQDSSGQRCCHLFTVGKTLRCLNCGRDHTLKPIVLLPASFVPAIFPNIQNDCSTQHNFSYLGGKSFSEGYILHLKDGG